MSEDFDFALFPEDRSREEARLDASFERAIRYVRTALQENRPLHPRWRHALEDAITDVEKIVRRNAHPDDVSHARLAMDSLLGLWLSDDEREALFDDYVLSPKPVPDV